MNVTILLETLCKGGNLGLVRQGTKDRQVEVLAAHPFAKSAKEWGTQLYW
jgi:hypothetical protein